MTRVLLFSTTASPIGGVETWLDRCCQYFSSQGMDPIVGLARGQTYNEPKRFLEFHPDLESVEVDGRGLNAEGRVRALMRCIRKVRPSVVLPMSVVEANDAAIRCKTSGDDVRLVVHAQGNLPTMLADLLHYRPGIDHVVCPGRLTHRFLTDRGGFEQDLVTHIPNGADTPTHERTAPTRPIRLGYVGRFTAGDKRVLDLIDLYRELTESKIDFSLTIVGDGPDGPTLRESLEHHANVSFPGPVSHDQLYGDIFPNLDALVLVSSSEAFGIVLAEAMMHGVVPITSQYMGYHSEKLVVHGETGLSFPIGDMKSAAAQIERLACDPGLTSALSRNGIKNTKANYTWAHSLGQWSDLVRKVSEHPPRQIDDTYTERVVSQSGRLDSLGMPGLADWARRCRRFLFGSSVPDGGEEWPLYWTKYPDDRLSEITESLRALDEAFSAKATEVTR